MHNYYYGTMTTSGIYKDEKKIRTYKASEKKKKENRAQDKNRHTYTISTTFLLPLSRKEEGGNQKHPHLAIAHTGIQQGTCIYLYRA